MAAPPSGDDATAVPEDYEMVIGSQVIIDYCACILYLRQCCACHVFASTEMSMSFECMSRPDGAFKGADDDAPSIDCAPGDEVADGEDPAADGGDADSDSEMDSAEELDMDMIDVSYEPSSEYLVYIQVAFMVVI